MIIDSIDPRRILDWVKSVWAKSLAAAIMFVLGLWVGNINTENRIAADCKFAGAFRVEIQAYNCQRRI